MTRVALITGAARRVGSEIARLLHKNHINIVLHYRSSYIQAQALCDELNKSRANSACCVQADLCDFSGIPSFVESVREKWGGLNILINNASLFYSTPVDTATEKSWDDLANINLKAPFFLAQAAVPFIKEKSGSIINIIDIHAERPLKDYCIYSITKSGFAAMTRSLAKELAPNIRVNGVSPGAIMWPENGMADSDKAAILERIPLKSTGKPSDIAAAVLFLARDAPYVTGQILAVDGGRTLFS